MLIVSFSRFDWRSTFIILIWSKHNAPTLGPHIDYVQSLENHFGDNSSNAYDVNEIDSIPTVIESMEDYSECFS